MKTTIDANTVVASRKALDVSVEQKLVLCMEKIE